MIICGQFVRQFADGTMTIPKPNPAAELEMDKTFDRVGKELMWRVKTPKMNKSRAAKYYFKNKKVYLVGKGKSIESLRASQFEPRWPVICLNESHQYIDKLGLENLVFGFQQDHNVKHKGMPYSGLIFCSQGTKSFYKDVPGAYLYDNTDYGLPHGGIPTAKIAIEMLITFEVLEIILVGFDVLKDGSVEQAHFQNRGYQSRNLDVYRQQKNKILESLKKIKSSFL